MLNHVLGGAGVIENVEAHCWEYLWGLEKTFRCEKRERRTDQTSVHQPLVLLALSIPPPRPTSLHSSLRTVMFAARRASICSSCSAIFARDPLMTISTSTAACAMRFRHSAATASAVHTAEAEEGRRIEISTSREQGQEAMLKIERASAGRTTVHLTMIWAKSEAGMAIYIHIDVPRAGGRRPSRRFKGHLGPREVHLRAQWSLRASTSVVYEVAEGTLSSDHDMGQTQGRDRNMYTYRRPASRGQEAVLKIQGASRSPGSASASARATVVASFKLWSFTTLICVGDDRG
ncbi:hypothetical protein AcV7_002746 [Taiwanofungus camphoratus]|nr:hypothetical protein AcV7_002746 [Antrodia cinnamomea]